MTEPAPLVSVVLPAHDAAETIRDAVDSILGQSLRELELIVVDDGSTDETAHVLAGIDDPRLVVHRLPEHRGHVAALHTAIGHSRAAVIARMDADDVALPERLAREHDVLQRRPSVGLVSTAFVSVDAQDRELGRHGVPPDHAAAWFRLHFANCLAHPTVMFRRSAYEAAGGYDERLAPAEDHDLWLRMAELVEIATISDPLLRYRQTGASLSARAGEQMTRASIGISARAIERTAGCRPSERVLEGLRDEATLTCEDAPAVLDVVVPVYSAIRQRCAARDLPTWSLPGQLAAVLALGGLREPDGRWCRRGLAHLVRRHPRVAATLIRDRISSRANASTAAAPARSSGSGSPDW